MVEDRRGKAILESWIDALVYSNPLKKKKTKKTQNWLKNTGMAWWWNLRPTSKRQNWRKLPNDKVIWVGDWKSIFFWVRSALISGDNLYLICAKALEANMQDTETWCSCGHHHSRQGDRMVMEAPALQGPSSSPGKSQVSWGSGVFSVRCFLQGWPPSLWEIQEGSRRPEHCIRGSLVAQRVKNPPAMQETWVQSLGWEDALEKGMAIHSSILTWRLPGTAEPGRLQSKGLQRVRHGWVTVTTPGHGLVPVHGLLGGSWAERQEVSSRWNWHHLFSDVHGKIFFHETGSWCQKIGDLWSVWLRGTEYQGRLPPNTHVYTNTYSPPLPFPIDTPSSARLFITLETVSILREMIPLDVYHQTTPSKESPPSWLLLLPWTKWGLLCLFHVWSVC